MSDRESDKMQWLESVQVEKTRGRAIWCVGLVEADSQKERPVQADSYLEAALPFQQDLCVLEILGAVCDLAPDVSAIAARTRA